MPLGTIVAAAICMCVVAGAAVAAVRPDIAQGVARSFSSMKMPSSGGGSAAPSSSAAPVTCVAPAAVDGQGIAYGQVLDYADKPLANATITAQPGQYTGTRPTYTVTTGADGCYMLVVPPNSYSIRASKETYPSSQLTPLALNPGQVRMHDFTLAY